MKERASNNRTLTLTAEDETRLSAQIRRLEPGTIPLDIADQVFCQDLMEALPQMPESFADLLIIDPPYNLARQFGEIRTAHRNDHQYYDYVMQWLPSVVKWLKADGSIYICCDWASSPVIYQAMVDCGLTIRNRITWQREKGRGAAHNWKNGMEDIWFGTIDRKNYYCDVEAVKMKRRVLAPYRDQEGKPKDWDDTDDGKYRLTYPSNFWDDISIPYWSMPENTDHPTQKPEKLIAKLILASCPPDGIVADPFLGSGTTAVTARKLGRHYIGFECNSEYVLWTLRRLEMAETNRKIQGFADGVFWERNSGK